MKKLLLILTIGAFAACNDSAKSTESTIDSSANAISDSSQKRGDSLTTKVDSTYGIKADSAKAKADTLKK